MRPVLLTPEAAEAVNALQRWRTLNGTVGGSIERIDGSAPLIALIKGASLILRHGTRKHTLQIDDERYARRLAAAINGCLRNGGTR